ncbi:MAG: purine-nucleoside phosphorylase [Saprospiraceae bacterium]|nr:purine-nucleoside phosphorylase [Saprospiraceae bacterium]
MNTSYFDEIIESAEFIKERMSIHPEIAIILGTGLGNLVEQIQIHKEISYKLIPHFVPTTVESHSGKIILASWAGMEILILSGRLHYYEGYSPQQITFPIRVLKELGIKKLILTNASGTVNPNYSAGDIVFINDHINFHPENPLRGLYDPRLGDRFPDMSDVYDKSLLNVAAQCCKELNIKYNSGVYFGLQGPSLETPAEYRMIRLLGADIVGMSTVPEVIVAHNCGLKIIAASIVSNSSPETGLQEKTTIQSVIKVIQNSSLSLFNVFEKLIQKI